MNILFSIISLAGKKKESRKERYLSLLIDTDHIAGACWSMNSSGKPELTHAVARRIEKDSWKDRTIAGDEVITALEERAGTQNISKVIFGLPYEYLTDTGEIKSETKHHLKQFSKDLELNPIGFVPIHQAIIYKLRQDEGVPPSLILLGVTDSSVSISLYVLGKLIGHYSLSPNEDIAVGLVRIIQNLTDLTTLPSRILIFGIDIQRLVKIKEELTRFSWTSHVKFLHFPKFQIVSADTAVASVSLAGSSELANQTETLVFSETAEKEGLPNEPDELPENTIVHKEKAVASKISAETLSDDQPDIDKKRTVIADDVGISINKPHENGQDNIRISGESVNNSDKNEIQDKEYAFDEESNVTFVSPESIGFRKNTDIIEEKLQIETDSAEESISTVKKVKESGSVNVSEKDEDYAIYESDENKGKINRLGLLPSRLFPIVFVAPVLLFLIGGYWYLKYQYPSASLSVTLTRVPVEETQNIIVDPDLSSVDKKVGSIPGLLKEATVSGESIVKTTGKKKVGDPSKGTVIIYNKVTSAKTFPKGTRLNSGSLAFTLDENVQIASATESIGSLTFGKTEISVTATEIGTQGNLPAGTEFSFKDISPSIVVARNDAAFSGGSSRDVIVVSRSDYDTIIESVINELTGAANEQLSQVIGDRRKLIDSTIDTEVAEQTFSAELNQEVPEVAGKLTLKVSGLTYDINDLNELFADVIKGSVPAGYELDNDVLKFDFSETEIQKNGSVKANVLLQGFASPKIDGQTIKEKIAGKNKDDAVNELKKIPGVSEVSVNVRNPLSGNTIPSNNSKISIIFSEE